MEDLAVEIKDYFERAKHEKCTRNNNHTVKLPLMKTTGQKCVAFTGGRILNNLALEARKIESRIVFTSFSNIHFALRNYLYIFLFKNSKHIL